MLISTKISKRKKKKHMLRKFDCTRIWLRKDSNTVTFLDRTVFSSNENSLSLTHCTAKIRQKMPSYAIFVLSHCCLKVIHNSRVFCRLLKMDTCI